MGSQGTIGTNEAAIILGVSPRHVKRLAESGQLTRLVKKKGLDAFSEDEVRELSSARSKARTASVTALQALALAKRTERELREIKLLLCLDSVDLGVDKDAVVQLFVKVESICAAGTIDLLETDVWIKTLLAIDDAYLSVVARCTGEPEPWEPYMKLAQLLYEVTIGKERAKADYARRNLRNVAFLYARRKLGAPKANQHFQDGSFSDRLLGMVISHL
jgi:hypothetical protein